MDDPDKDEKIDISLSSMGDGDNDVGIESATNQQVNKPRLDDVELRTAAKTKKIEEDSDDEDRKEGQIDKTASKFMINDNFGAEHIQTDQIAAKRAFAS